MQPFKIEQNEANFFLKQHQRLKKKDSNDDVQDQEFKNQNNNDYPIEKLQIKQNLKLNTKLEYDYNYNQLMSPTKRSPIRIKTRNNFFKNHDNEAKNNQIFNSNQKFTLSDQQWYKDQLNVDSRGKTYENWFQQKQKEPKVRVLEAFPMRSNVKKYYYNNDKITMKSISPVQNKNAIKSKCIHLNYDAPDKRFLVKPFNDSNENLKPMFHINRKDINDQQIYQIMKNFVPNNEISYQKIAFNKSKRQKIDEYSIVADFRNKIISHSHQKKQQLKYSRKYSDGQQENVLQTIEEQLLTIKNDASRQQQIDSQRQQQIQKKQIQQQIEITQNLQIQPQNEERIKSPQNKIRKFKQLSIIYENYDEDQLEESQEQSKSKIQIDEQIHSTLKDSTKMNSIEKQKSFEYNIKIENYDDQNDDKIQEQNEPYDDDHQESQTNQLNKITFLRSQIQMELDINDYFNHNQIYQDDDSDQYNELGYDNYTNQIKLTYQNNYIEQDQEMELENRNEMEYDQYTNQIQEIQKNNQKEQDQEMDQTETQNQMDNDDYFQNQIIQTPYDRNQYQNSFAKQVLKVTKANQAIKKMLKK